MKNLWRGIASTLLAILLVTIVAGIRVDMALSQDARPQFQQVDCTAEFDVDVSADNEAECGYVTVPLHRNQSAQAGDDLRLAVVVLKSNAETPQPDPFFMAQGGPGGSTIDSFADLMAYHPIRDERDIVLFDQRGAFYSQPNLVCSELTDILPEVLPLPEEEARPLRNDALAACRRRLAAEGVDLSAFNSIESAADVDAIRRALGYDEINFYGVSYGTLLGLHLMRDHPDRLRSVILDGVVAPQTDFLLYVPENTERVFSELFAACVKNVTCNEQYPDLEQRFVALVDRFDQEPVFVSITEPDTGTEMQVRLAGDDLIDIAFQVFYMDGGAAILPRLIAEMENEDYSFAVNFLPLLLFDRTWSDGLYQSVICAEEPDAFQQEARVADVRARFARDAQENLQEYAKTCRLWDVSTLPSSVNDAVSSDLPTLLLSGRFDPITPARFAEQAAETLSSSVLVTDPTGGHGVGLSYEPCITQIMEDFLDRPDSTPDTTCLDPAAQPDFAPADAVKVELVGELSRLNPDALAQILASALFLFGLATALLVWPLEFLLRALRNSSIIMTDRERRLRHWSRLFVLLYCSLAFLFALTLAAVTVYVAFENEMLLWLSLLPSWIAPLLMAPILLVILAVLIVGATIQQWRWQAGSLANRLYYTFLAFCATGYLFTLGVSGLL